MSNMKKSGKIYRIGALLVVVCLISTVMLSGTFAKYVSEYSGKDTALVARWSFTGNFDDKELSTYNGVFPIWDHDYVTNIYQQHGGDYLIAPGVQGEFRVEFTYDADVDADLIFNFEKSGNAANLVPIQYSLDDFATLAGIYYSLDALGNAIIATATTDSESTITPAGSNGTYVITDTATLEVDGTEDNMPVKIDETVSWRWPYNVADHVGTSQATDFPGTGTGNAWTEADDVKAGNSSQVANRDSYILNLEIKATQKTPTTTTP